MKKKKKKKKKDAFISAPADLFPDYVTELCEADNDG